MADRPIIFSAPMVRALIEGRKTQTRRVLCQFDPERDPPSAGPYFAGHKAATWTDSEGTPWRYPGAKGAATGDRLYVREAWQSNGLNWGKRPRDMRPGLGAVHYAATDNGEWQSYWGNWKPSIHMPRWASRLTLVVTDVRVQRLQDISEADAVAEGCDAALALTMQRPNGAYPGSPREAFKDIWNSLHGPDAWDENQWVVALTFTVEQRNIDAGGA